VLSKTKSSKEGLFRDHRERGENLRRKRKDPRPQSKKKTKTNDRKGGIVPDQGRKRAVVSGGGRGGVSAGQEKGGGKGFRLDARKENSTKSSKDKRI